MTLIGYTMMCEQAGPEAAGARRRPRRGGGLRLRGHQRSLLPVAGVPGPLAVRVERARRRGAGHRPHSADDVRHLPDPPLSPCRRRAEGGDDAAALRRALHAGPRRGGEPERAHRRRTLADRRRAPRDARGSGGDHSGPVGRRHRDVSGQVLRRRVGEGLGPSGNRAADRDRGARTGQLSSGGTPCRRDDRSRARARARPRCSTRREAPGSHASVRSRCRTTPTSRPPSSGRMDQFRWFTGGWRVNAELPLPASFDVASKTVREEDVTAQMPCGPDVRAAPRRHPRVRSRGLHPHRVGAGRRGLARGIHLVGGDGAAARIPGVLTAPGRLPMGEGTDEADRLAGLLASQREFYDLRAPDFGDEAVPDRRVSGNMPIELAALSSTSSRLTGDVLELACGSGSSPASSSAMHER